MRRIACIHWTAADGKPPTERGESQIVERCGRFSPIVGFDPADRRSVFLDVTGLAHLFGGETALAEAIIRDLVRFGYTARVAVADTLGAAWAAVHYCKMKNANCKMQNGPGSGSHALRGNSAILAVRIEAADMGRCSRQVPTRSVGTRRQPEPICIFHFSFCILQSFAILHPLPIEALRLPPETVRLLHELGLVRIGQLESLPREEFLSRFGPLLLQRMDQAFGRLDEPVPACPLPPRFEAGWSAEHPTARRETIAAAVEWLIARVAAMLARCGRGALRLDCRVFLEINNQQSTINSLSLSVGLFQPTADAKRLFDLVQLQLERLRIGSPVTAIEAAASLSAPLEPRKQAMLFDLDGDLRRPRRLAALVERLCSRLGSRAVAGVRLRSEAQPELSWHYDPLVGRQRRKFAQRPKTSRRREMPLCCNGGTLESGSGLAKSVSLLRRGSGERSPTAGTACEQAVAHGELPPRPLRLLPRPLAAAVTWIAPGGPPLRFQLDGCEHEIARSWGPERIETGWWRGRAVGRDYFRVETAAGGHFWLFRRLRDGKWFLHGLFE